MLRCRKAILAVIVAAACVPFLFQVDAPTARAADKPKWEDEYKALQFKTMPYRLLIPANYDKAKHYPLLLALHGFGERGTDNTKPLKYYGGLFAESQVREKYPCFVILPQAPGVWISFHDPANKPIPVPKKTPESIALALEILETVEKEYRVDKHRLYLSGASNGACGVWYLLERDPKLWAAAVPVSGAGDPRAIGVAHHIPIWAYQGDKDTEIFPERGRELIAALKAAGGYPKYTEMPGLGHGDAIKKALGRKMADAEWLPWMFEQVKEDGK